MASIQVNAARGVVEGPQPLAEGGHVGFGGIERLLRGSRKQGARLRHHAESIVEIYVQSARNDPRSRDLANLARSHGVSVVPVDAARLQGLSGGARHQGSSRPAQPRPASGAGEVPRQCEAHANHRATAASERRS